MTVIGGAVGLVRAVWASKTVRAGVGAAATGGELYAVLNEGLEALLFPLPQILDRAHSVRIQRFIENITRSRYRTPACHPLLACNSSEDPLNIEVRVTKKVKLVDSKGAPIGETGLALVLCGDHPYVALVVGRKVWLLDLLGIPPELGLEKLAQTNAPLARFFQRVATDSLLQAEHTAHWAINEKNQVIVAQILKQLAGALQVL
jgi:hypothetical protein